MKFQCKTFDYIVKKKVFSENNVLSFNRFLSQVDWNFFTQIGDSNKQFECFFGVVQIFFDGLFPFKTGWKKCGDKKLLSKDLNYFPDWNVDLGITARDFKDFKLKQLLLKGKALS